MKVLFLVLIVFVCFATICAEAENSVEYIDQCSEKIFETNEYLDFEILKQKISSLNWKKITNIVFNIEVSLNITELSKMKLKHSLINIQNILNSSTSYVVEGFSSDISESFIIKAYNCSNLKQ